MKPDRIFKEEYLNILGAEHYLLHYHSKPEDPVLLFIHGGPGQTESFIAYIVEEYAERNYNIVYYDQRGAGKTYLKSKKEKPDTETLKKDLLEIVLYLKKRYQKEKIGILGHSWGSVLGSMFALEYPEHTLCYIGCGQLINMLQNERVGLEKLKEAIEKAENKKDQKKLEKIGEYPPSHFDMKEYRKMGIVRNLQGKYDLAVSFDKDMIKKIMKSPIMGIKDILPFITGGVVNRKVMAELMSFDLREKGIHYEVPVFYVLGERDWQTPVEIGKAYFKEIEAPFKKLYLIKEAGHITMLDNLPAYRRAVCEIVDMMKTY